MSRVGGTRRLVVAVVAVVSAWGIPWASGGPLEDRTLPNLVPLAPTDLQVGLAEGYDQMPPYALRFSSTVFNKGDYALDVQGQDQGQDRPALAMQCVKWVAYGVCLEREEAGEFVYHPGHSHYHIADFGYFELRRLQENRTPDPSPEALVASSHKISFCVVDYYREEIRLGPWMATGNPVYGGCGVVSQGISAGWADVYGYYVEGQQIIIDGVADGDYALVAQVNAARLLHETTYLDNDVFIPVTISENGTQVAETY